MKKAEIIKQLTKRGVDGIIKNLDKQNKQFLERVLEKVENFKLDYLSFTQVSTYNDCGLKYFFRYVLGIKIPPKAIMTLGLVSHETIEYGYKEKLKNKEPQVSELIDYFDYRFDEHKEETIWDEPADEVRKNGHEVIKKHNENFMAKINPLAVEQEFEIDLKLDIPVKFKGVIDLETEHFIVENKISSRSKSIEAYMPQLIIYSKQYNKPAEVHKLIVQKKGVRTEREQFSPNDEHFKVMKRLIETTVKAINKGVFLPAKPFTYPCTPKWCGYWDLCMGELK